MNAKMKTIAEWFLSKLPAISTMTIALIGVMLGGCGGMPILMETPEISKGSNYSLGISTSLAKEISGTRWDDRPYVIPKWALTCHRSLHHFSKTDIGINFGIRMHKELDFEYTVFPLYPGGEIKDVKSLKSRYELFSEAVFKRNLFTGSSNSCAIAIALPVVPIAWLTILGGNFPPGTKVYLVGSHNIGESKALYFSPFFHHAPNITMYNVWEAQVQTGADTPGVGVILGSAFKASFAYVHVEFGLGAYFEEYEKDLINDRKAFLHPFINVGVRQR